MELALFGHHIPWGVSAPAWAIELRVMLGLVLENQEKIMSDLTNLNAAIAALQTEVGDIGTQMDKLFADLTAAHGTGDQAAIDTATAAITAQVDALKAIGTRDTSTAPAPAAG